MAKKSIKRHSYQAYEKLLDTNPHYYKKRNQHLHNDFCFEKSKRLKSNKNTLLFKNEQGEVKQITIESYINRLAFIFTQSTIGGSTSLFTNVCNQIRKQASETPDKIFAPPERLFNRIKKAVNR